MCFISLSWESLHISPFSHWAVSEDWSGYYFISSPAIYTPTPPIQVWSVAKATQPPSLPSLLILPLNPSNFSHLPPFPLSLLLSLSILHLVVSGWFYIQQIPFSPFLFFFLLSSPLSLSLPPVSTLPVVIYFHLCRSPPFMLSIGLWHVCNV